MDHDGSLEEAAAALRASLRRALGGPRRAPLHEDGQWVDDWPVLAELGASELLDETQGGGAAALPLAVATVTEVARALHGFPASAVLPATAHRTALAGLLPSSAVLGAARLAPGGLPGHEGPGGRRSDPVAGLDGLTHLLLVDDDGTTRLVALTDVAVLPEPSLDVTRSLGRVRLAGPAGTVLPDVDGGYVVRVARLLTAADTVAVTALAVERTVEHARERQAFGGPIARHQAVQHRLVDHAVVAQQLSDLLDRATTAVLGDENGDRGLATLETFCHERASAVISDCIQLTGAVGFTWEHGLHFALRRAAGNAQVAGGARRARRELIAAAGW